MHGSAQLAIAYLRRNPRRAAQELDRLESAEASEFLAAIPPPVAAPALALMLPTAAVACLLAMDTLVAAKLLDRLSGHAAAALLRAVAEAPRKALLAQMSPLQGPAVAMLINYPETVVGAWLTTGATTLSSEMSVAEARKALRSSGGRLLPRLFVVDAGTQLRGAVELSELLRCSHNGELLEIAELSPAHLLTRLPLAVVAGHSNWHQHSELPVLNRQGNFVGVLEYRVLMQQLQRTEGAIVGEGASGEVLAELVGDAVAGTWQSWKTLIGADVEAGNGQR